MPIQFLLLKPVRETHTVDYFWDTQYAATRCTEEILYRRQVRSSLGAILIWSCKFRVYDEYWKRCFNPFEERVRFHMVRYTHRLSPVPVVLVLRELPPFFLRRQQISRSCRFSIHLKAIAFSAVKSGALESREMFCVQSIIRSVDFPSLIAIVFYLPCVTFGL